MAKPAPAAQPAPSTPSGDTARKLLAALQRLHADLLAAEQAAAQEIAAVGRSQRVSARNLVHYLALRRHDLRRLQRDLSALGLSSLGRCESHVLAHVEQVIAALAALGGKAGVLPSGHPVDHRSGPRRLARHADDCFGRSPARRDARIMVTLPSEAAGDPALIDRLLAAGMDLARINCAHDGPEAWDTMIGHLRSAGKKRGRNCPVLMDLAGPKLRTGAIAPGVAIASWHPQRDQHGRVVRPACVALTSAGVMVETSSQPDAVLPVDAGFTDRAWLGDAIDLEDARGKRRRLSITNVDGPVVLAEADATAYVEPGTRLRLLRGTVVIHESEIGPLPPVEQPLLLHAGETLLITADATPGRPAVREADGTVIEPARIPCSLPQVLGEVKAGERVFLDDGKIGGVVRAATAETLTIEVTQARLGGVRLRSDKGINLPDSSLTLPCLDADDLAHLRFAQDHADLIGLSFVRRPQDVDDLLDAMGDSAKRPGIVLKIETPQAFADLPDILMRALAAGRVGVMVARGDLAVEVGFARIAEVQEEILWLCEAAHIPVIWGTQVLESLAKKGLATRAEVTDAAMSVRAECVMLNKGPYVTEAVAFLDDVLTRMQAHQSKKNTLLRRLAVSKG